MFSVRTFLCLLKYTCNFGPNYMTHLVTCRKRKNTLVGRVVKITVKLRTDKDREKERKMPLKKRQDKQVSNLLLDINLLINYFSCNFKAQVTKKKHVPSKRTPILSINRQMKGT